MNKKSVSEALGESLNTVLQKARESEVIATKEEEREYRIQMAENAVKDLIKVLEFESSLERIKLILAHLDVIRSIELGNLK